MLSLKKLKIDQKPNSRIALFGDLSGDLQKDNNGHYLEVNLISRTQ